MFRAIRFAAAGVLALSAACTRGQAAAPPKAAPPAVATAAESEPQHGIEVIAPYPASLVYALDGAIGEIRHAAGYDALLGLAPLERPSWLVAYRDVRAPLRGKEEDDDGWYSPFTRCSYVARGLDDFLRCTRPIVLDAAPRIEQAIREADARMSPRWASIEPELRTFGDKLATAVEGKHADDLLLRLRGISAIGADVPLNFRVVLVAKAPGGKNYAHQEGAFLVLEVSKELRPERSAAIVYHEIAHLAFHRSRGVDELEKALAAEGERGVVAGNLWEEGLASAFGNGIAAAKVDPRFHEADAMYADPAIDGMGHVLYRRLLEEGQGGEKVVLGAPLAKMLVQALDDAWPKSRWRIHDVLQRVVIFSETQELARTFGDHARTIASYAKSPLGDDLDRAPKAPPGTPRFVIASLPALLAAKSMMGELGVSAADLQARLKGAKAVVRWTYDAAGVPVVLLVGRDLHETEAALVRWADADALPKGAWTAL